MKPLNKKTSDALDAMFYGLPENVKEAARELFIANNEQELRLSAKGFQIVVGTELRKLEAKGIRKAVHFAEARLNEGADPVEALCLVEGYANSIDPEHKDNVVSISQGNRDE